MKIDITARHSDLAPGVRDYIEDRGQRISRYFEGAQRCEFVLDQEHGVHVVEINVHAPKHHDMTAKCSHEDLHASIDGALDKIERQIRRLKERFKDHHRGEKPQLVSEPEPEDSGETTYEDVIEREL